MDALTIHEAAETTGWSPRMLRYIERIGLVEAPRSDSGYRLYGAAQLQRLRTLREAEGEDPVASVGPAAHAGPEIHLDPPWEGYDAMALDEVLGRLQSADPTTLAAVRLYESTHESRQAILLATETP